MNPNSVILNERELTILFNGMKFFLDDLDYLQLILIKETDGTFRLPKPEDYPTKAEVCALINKLQPRVTTEDSPRE